MDGVDLKRLVYQHRHSAFCCGVQSFSFYKRTPPISALYIYKDRPWAIKKTVKYRSWKTFYLFFFLKITDRYRLYKPIWQTWKYPYFNFSVIVAPYSCCGWWDVGKAWRQNGEVPGSPSEEWKWPKFWFRLDGERVPADRSETPASHHGAWSL